MREVAHAKINLALHVRGREASGYHRIETVFAFAEDGDLLSAESADALTLAVTGPFAEALEGGDNLVLRAAEALRERYGIAAGAALHLDKALPVAAGLGGGSADAAAALRLLSRLWGVDAGDEELIDIARPLGADVSACVRSETARGEGRGDVLVSQDGAGLAGMPLLLVNPRLPLSTAAVFAGWGGEDKGALAISSPLSAALESRNDLEPPARALVPAIGDILRLLAAAPGAILARMSGSGASCFALFAGDASRDAAAAAATARGWWTCASRLR